MGPHTGADSERVRLARLALVSALSVTGVVRSDGGRLHAQATPVRGAKPLEGVVCAALAGGGYEVTLRLVATLVPLQPLARDVTVRVRRAAEAAGLGASLESVSVHFVDIERDFPVA